MCEKKKVLLYQDAGERIICTACKKKLGDQARPYAEHIDFCPECVRKKEITHKALSGEPLCRLHGGKLHKKKLAIKLKKGREESGYCVECTREKKPLRYILRGQLICDACAGNFLFGPWAKNDLMPEAKKRFSEGDVLLTLMSFSWTEALGKAKSWYSANRGKIAKRRKTREFYDACKQHSLALPVIPNEPTEFRRIRKDWAESRYPQCLTRYFGQWLQGDEEQGPDRIRREHAPERRERMRRINKGLPGGDYVKYESKKGKRPKYAPSMTEVTYALVAPVCSDCSNLELHGWGWWCRLQNSPENPRLPDFPSFPTNTLKLSGKMYRLLQETIELELGYKKQGAVAQSGRIMAGEFLDRYGYREFQNTNNPDAYIWFRSTGERKKKPLHAATEGASVEAQEFSRFVEQIYLMYPKTDVLLVEPGDWVHYVLNAPTASVMVSTCGDHEEARYYPHREILMIKAYAQQERQGVGKKAEPMVTTQSGGTYGIGSLKAALRHLVQKGEVPGLPEPKNFPEENVAFEAWFDAQPKELLDIVIEQAESNQWVFETRAALMSLMDKGRLGRFKLPPNGTFTSWYLPWYGELDSDVRKMIDAQMEALTEKRKRKLAEKDKPRLTSGEAQGGEDGTEQQDAPAKPKSRRRKGDKPPRSGYYRIPRQWGSHSVRLVLHGEARAIADDLKDKPGRVVVVDPVRHLYKKEGLDRKKLNQRLMGDWPENTFGQLFTYKARLAGFEVEENEYDLDAPAHCPHCDQELGSGWQELLIVNDLWKAQCPSCQEIFKLPYGIVCAARKDTEEGTGFTVGENDETTEPDADREQVEEGEEYDLSLVEAEE